MSQTTRILIAIAIMLTIVAAVVAVDLVRRNAGSTSVTSAEPTLAPGSVPVYLDQRLVAGFSPTDLEQLQQVGFVDSEEGKEQDGWLLRDVLLLHLDAAQLPPGTTIRVISTSREKAAELTWEEVDDPENMVMFDLSNRGTLKLVSTLEKLDTRDEWVQDVDRIEIVTAENTEP